MSRQEKLWSTRSSRYCVCLPRCWGLGGLKEPICLKALCEQSTLYFTFLFTLLIFGQSKEE